MGQVRAATSCWQNVKVENSSLGCPLNFSGLWNKNSERLVKTAGLPKWTPNKLLTNIRLDLTESTMSVQQSWQWGWFFQNNSKYPSLCDSSKVSNIYINKNILSIFTPPNLFAFFSTQSPSERGFSPRCVPLELLPPSSVWASWEPSWPLSHPRNCLSMGWLMFWKNDEKYHQKNMI